MGGGRKSDDLLGIKDNSFLYCWELSVSLKVISEKKTSCEPNLLLHTWYQQILTPDRISLQHTASRACGKEKRWQQNILLKHACKYTGWVGRFPTRRLNLIQTRLFGLPDLQTVSLKCMDESLNAWLESAGETAFILNHYCNQEIPDFHICLKLDRFFMKCIRKVILLSTTRDFC